MNQAEPPDLDRSWLTDEIAEQPDALRRLLDEADEPARRVAGLLSQVGSVLVAARGSSDNAARYAQYLLGTAHRLPVTLAAPSLVTRYDAPPRLDRTLVLGISQSGRSPDVVGVVAAAAAQGQPTVAVTNDPGSDLAGAADVVVLLHAGPERSVASTKTYVNSLGALALVSAHASADDDGGTRLRALRELPAQLRETLDRGDDDAVAAVAAGLGERCLVVGRGLNHATAYEVALKLEELTGITAQPYSAADVRHGPIGAVRRSFPVLLVAPDGEVFDDVAGLVAPLRERGAWLAAITADPGLAGRVDAALPLPAGLPEWLSPLVAVLPGQRLAAHIAASRGIDVDRPGGLSKVTETH